MALEAATHDDIALHTALIEQFEASADALHDALQRAERDVDYYDGKQWTAAEKKELEKRGQPVIAFNLVRQKIEFMEGLEEAQRTVPQALPRTPAHDDESHSVTDALRYVTGQQKYEEKRPEIWSDMLKAGWGGVEVVVEKTTKQDMPWRVVIRRIPWDRMFWDPHSSAKDFKDAAYVGQVVWQDRRAAIRNYGEGAAVIFDTTIAGGADGAGGRVGETYDDKPKYTNWIDHSRRKRIRVIQVYYIDDDGEWSYCEFTKAGILKMGPSPWLDEDGKREHPYAWRSTYINRDNERYGAIRDLTDPQDEVNKRRSKALHGATTRQIFGSEAAFAGMDARDIRKELNRPDGYIKLGPTAKWGDNVGIVPTSDQNAQQFSLLQDAQRAFEVMGPNASMMGKREGNESGRAIQAQMQGGSIQQGPKSGLLRGLDMDVYRMIWNRIRQFWTGPTWVRVTDELDNLKWVGLNQPMADPMTGMQAVDPMTGQPVLQNNVAELDVDIDMSDSPDPGTIQAEEFDKLISLAQVGIIFPRKVYLAASNLRNKSELIQMDEQENQADPMAQAAAEAELAERQAKAQKTAAEVEETQADTINAIMDAALKQREATAPPMMQPFLG